MALALFCAAVLIAVSAWIHWRVPHLWPWIEFLLGSVPIFVILAAEYEAELKEPRCLLAYLALLGTHTAVLVYLIGSGTHIRIIYYIPISILELLVFAVALRVVGTRAPQEEGREEAE